MHQGDVLVFEDLHVAHQLSLRVVGVEDWVCEELRGAFERGVV